MERDEAIRRCYDAQEATADEIVAEPDLCEAFCAEVNSHLPAASHFQVVELNKRLLHLRKVGEKKGGLRRKRRAYNGRSSKLAG